MKYSNLKEEEEDKKLKEMSIVIFYYQLNSKATNLQLQ